MGKTPLEKTREKSKSCTACPLYKIGTQTVFGAGSENAKIVIVGEQPGNEEDLTGLPFVGPAGKILEKALVAAGIERKDVYLTNAVKHFKWTPSDRPSKPRLHKKPNTAEIKACRPWLEAELKIIKPQMVLALGRTSAFSCLGRQSSIGKERGHPLEVPEHPWKYYVSWHPSAILRAIDEKTRTKLLNELIEDLKQLTKV